MNKRFHGKKGSTSVFLIAILLSMVLVIGILVEASSGKAARSYSDGVLRLSGNSILTEYNRALKNDYGLFAFNGNKEVMESKMTMYAEASFDHKEQEKSMDLLRLKMDSVKVDTAGYSLTELHVLEEGIVNYMGYRFAEMALDQVISKNNDSLSEIEKSTKLSKEKRIESESLEKSIEEDEKKKEAKGKSKRSKEKEKDQKKKIQEGKLKVKKIKAFGENVFSTSVNRNATGSAILKNQMIIAALPSKTLDKPIGFGLGSASAKSAVVNEYILDTFGNQLSPGKHGQGFFRNEVEYIICGGFNDQDNYKKVKTEILVMRTSLNIAHIYSDKVKQKETLALAASLTPGPWIPVTQFIIISAWGAAEAGNDIRLLEEGKRVPLLKNADSWALDLSGLLEEKGKAEPRSVGKWALDYNGYLRILLSLKNENEKLIRIMDLIQINMKGTDNKNFLLKDYCTGFQYEVWMTKKSGFFGVTGESTRPAQVTGVCQYERNRETKGD